MGTVCLNIEELPVYFSKYGSILYSYMQCMKALIPLASHQYLKKIYCMFGGRRKFSLTNLRAKIKNLSHSKVYSFWLILRFQSSFPHFMLFSGCHIITEDTSLLWRNVLWNQLSWTHELCRDCWSYVDLHPSYVVLCTLEGSCLFVNFEIGRCES